MKMKQEIKIKPLIAAIAIPLAVGGLSAFITKDAMSAFELLRKPPLSPPAWLFPVAWTILYILMGIASYFVWNKKVSPARKERALSFYAIQLAANFLWSIIFFSLEMYLAAFLWLVMLFLLVLVTGVLFYYIDKNAGRLMIPYVLWCGFALYLNLGVWILNR